MWHPSSYVQVYRYSTSLVVICVVFLSYNQQSHVQWRFEEQLLWSQHMCQFMLTKKGHFVNAIK